MIQVTHDPLGRDLRHVIVRLMDPLATAVLQGEGDGAGEVVLSASWSAAAGPVAPLVYSSSSGSPSSSPRQR
jgi:hypothetical protein